MCANTASKSDGLRLIRARESLEVAECLASQARWRYSVVCYWFAIRDLVFYRLEQDDRAFTSTEEALHLAISGCLGDEAGVMLMEAYHLATIAEWDETTAVERGWTERLSKLAVRIATELQGPAS